MPETLTLVCDRGKGINPDAAERNGARRYCSVLPRGEAQKGLHSTAGVVNVLDCVQALCSCPAEVFVLQAGSNFCQVRVCTARSDFSAQHFPLVTNCMVGSPRLPSNQQSGVHSLQPPTRHTRNSTTTLPTPHPPLRSLELHITCRRA